MYPYRRLCSIRGLTAEEEEAWPQENVTMATKDDQRLPRARKTQSLSLPTISPPPELQTALQKVLSRKRI